ncbi:unnamed protein product [Meloidogyne enterolobii]
MPKKKNIAALKKETVVVQEKIEPIINEDRYEYTDEIDNTLLEGFVCLPDHRTVPNAPIPGVLVCHAFGGIGNLEEEKCRELAKAGYIAFAADLYGKGKRGQTFEENMALLKPFREDRTNLLRRRLFLGLQCLRDQMAVDKEKIAVIGFCFGGLCALDLARVNVGIKIAVSFHGTFTPLPDQPDPEKEKPIEASVLICHGDADTHIPHEQCMNIMAEMRARKADWQFISYGNAKHGFTDKELENSTREGVGYNEQADKRSWMAMLALFKEKFGNTLITF